MSLIGPLHSAGPSLATPTRSPGAAEHSAGSGFTSLIDNVLGKLNGEQSTADQAVRDLALGQTDNLHGVMLAVAKADLSFRLFMEIRNRLTEAMQEIMRMQV